MRSATRGHGTVITGRPRPNWKSPKCSSMPATVGIHLWKLISFGVVSGPQVQWRPDGGGYRVGMIALVWSDSL